MLRKSLLILTSLAAILTLCGLIFSYFEWRILRYGIPPRDSVTAHLWLGSFQVTHVHYSTDVVQDSGFSSMTRGLDLPNKGSIIYRHLVHFDIHWRRSMYGAGDEWSAISFPLWAPFLAFAAFPGLAFIRGPLRRWRRRRRGLCVKCGYDLTGNTTGTCPECGYTA